MTGYKMESVLLRGTAQDVAESSTKTAVSKVFTISAEDSLNMIVELTASAATGTVDVILQDSMDGTTWNDKKATTIASATTVSIKLTVADETNDAQYLPLRPLGRVVVTTAGGETITVSEVRRTMRL
jgi:hypothetical protein